MTEVHLALAALAALLVLVALWKFVKFVFRMTLLLTIVGLAAAALWRAGYLPIG